MEQERASCSMNSDNRDDRLSMIDNLFYGFEVCVWLVRIKDLVAVHDCDQILCLTEVDDVMGVSGQHVDALDVVATNLKLYHLVCTQFALLDKAMTGHNNEEFPFCVVPVLTFGDARLADVDAHLTAIQSVN